MEVPFVFGRAVEGRNFTDREEETRMLVNNFIYGVNTILISPRRYGKTSLVKKAGKEAMEKGIKVVYLDIFSARNSREFAVMFADAVIKQTYSKIEEIVSVAKDFLGRFHPKFSFEKEGVGEVSISFNIEDTDPNLDEILDMPEKIAAKKNCRILVCIDEFQQIGEFPDSLNFQKKLRTRWQHQQKTSYCLYGGKKHMMNELFALPSMPFYKFGEVINLKKIPTPFWIAFIKNKFEETGRPVSDEIAEKICELTENYSSYVQQLAWLLWTNFDPDNQEESLNRAYEQLIDHSAILFEQQTQELTAYQLNFLRMILEGKTEKYNSMETIMKYTLGSPANVTKIKTSLIKKELLEIDGRHLVIRDPILKEWLRRQFRQY